MSQPAPEVRLHCTRCDRSAGNVYQQPDGELIVITLVSVPSNKRSGRWRSGKAGRQVVEFTAAYPDGPVVAEAQCRCATHLVSVEDVGDAVAEGRRRLKLTPAHEPGWKSAHPYD